MFHIPCCVPTRTLFKNLEKTIVVESSARNLESTRKREMALEIADVPLSVGGNATREEREKVAEFAVITGLVSRVKHR